MKKTGCKVISVLVAMVVATTPSLSLAFGLGQASHALVIGKPLSIRIPVGSITGDFNPSCVALNKAEDDPAGDNFPRGMRVSMVPGEEPALLISGPIVKQPVVSFTVVSTCANAKFERSYVLLPDIGEFDQMSGDAQLQPVSPQSIEETKAASLPVTAVATTRVPTTPAKDRSRTDVGLRLANSLGNRSKTPARIASSINIGSIASQRLEKMSRDIDAAAASLNRLSNVVDGQMEVQLKSAHELSRISTLLVEHDEKIANIGNRLGEVTQSIHRHDEILSHRSMDGLLSSLGGGLLGFCFSAAGFFLYNRRRNHLSVQQMNSASAGADDTVVVHDDDHLDFFPARKIVRAA